jgi:hypothetical protein
LAHEAAEIGRKADSWRKTCSGASHHVRKVPKDRKWNLIRSGFTGIQFLPEAAGRNVLRPFSLVVSTRTQAREVTFLDDCTEIDRNYSPGADI